MDKHSKVMLKVILGSFSHMLSIDAESKALILAEIDRIEKKVEPKKKELDVEGVEEEQKNSEG